MLAKLSVPFSLTHSLFKLPADAHPGVFADGTWLPQPLPQEHLVSLAPMTSLPAKSEGKRTAKRKVIMVLFFQLQRTFLNLF